MNELPRSQGKGTWLSSFLTSTRTPFLQSKRQPKHANCNQVVVDLAELNPHTQTAFLQSKRTLGATKGC